MWGVCFLILSRSFHAFLCTLLFKWFCGSSVMRCSCLRNILSVSMPLSHGLIRPFSHSFALRLFSALLSPVLQAQAFDDVWVSRDPGPILLISGGMMVLLSKGGLGSCFVCVARVFVGSRMYKLECCHSASIPNLTLANGHSNDNSSCQLENYIVLSSLLVLEKVRGGKYCYLFIVFIFYLRVLTARGLSPKHMSSKSRFKLRHSWAGTRVCTLSVLFPDYYSYLWSRWGKGCCPNTDGLIPDHSKIILFWTWAPHANRGQVAASCFHYGSRQSPFAFSLTKFSFLSVCASSAVVPYFWAHCPKDKICFLWWPCSQGSHRKPGGFIAQLYLCSFRKCQGSADVQKALTPNHRAVGCCLNKSAELS